MRVLMTNITMASRTGTEIVTRDLAMGLASLGHRPIVFSPALGGLADELRDAGVPVVSRLEDITDPPEMIHGHHREETPLAFCAVSRAFPPSSCATTGWTGTITLRYPARSVGTSPLIGIVSSASPSMRTFRRNRPG